MKLAALVLEVAAMAFVVYGTALIYPPAAWIVTGAFLATFAYALENQES